MFGDSNKATFFLFLIACKVWILSENHITFTDWRDSNYKSVLLLQLLSLETCSNSKTNAEMQCIIHEPEAKANIKWVSVHASQSLFKLNHQNISLQCTVLPL